MQGVPLFYSSSFLLQKKQLVMQYSLFSLQIFTMILFTYSSFFIILCYIFFFKISNYLILTHQFSKKKPDKRVARFVIHGHETLVATTRVQSRVAGAGMAGVRSGGICWVVAM
jgi:hypothetical protein